MAPGHHRMGLVPGAPQRDLGKPLPVLQHRHIVQLLARSAMHGAQRYGHARLHARATVRVVVAAGGTVQGVFGTHGGGG